MELDVNVSPNEDTIWLNQDEISQLFGKAKSTINEHIKNILSNELNEIEVLRKFEKTELSRIKTKPITYYNLDMILAIGYRVNSKQGIVFRKWASIILKEYLLKGYVINENRTLVTNDNYARLINKVKSMDVRLNNVENVLNKKDLPVEKIFYNGETYDVYSFLQQLFEKATNEIIIIDNFINRTILDRLVLKKKNVKLIIYTDPSKSRLLGNDIKTFNKEYPTLDVKYINQFHDRFIIIDRIELYLNRVSLKDAGKKCFAISKIEDKDILKNLIIKYRL